MCASTDPMATSTKAMMICFIPISRSPESRVPCASSSHHSLETRRRSEAWRPVLGNVPDRFAGLHERGESVRLRSELVDAHRDLVVLHRDDHSAYPVAPGDADGQFAANLLALLRNCSTRF